MNKNIYLYILIFIVLIFIFFYFNHTGIKLGYILSGGKTITEEVTPNTDELLRAYNEQVRTYELYKDSDNPTAQQWAEAARLKANAIADEYNELMNEFILNGIGE